jgi:hypothetical protein
MLPPVAMPRQKSKKQKFAGRPGLSELFKGNACSDKKDRNLSIYKAHVERGYKLQEIADCLGMHYASISRIVVNNKSLIMNFIR